MLEKIILISALIATCNSNPVFLHGTYRDGRGVPISKTFINNNAELGRFSRINVLPCLKAVANYHNSETNDYSKAVAEINDGNRYYDRKTPTTLVAYKVPDKDGNELSVVEPQHAEATAIINGKSGYSASSYTRTNTGSASSTSRALQDLPALLKNEKTDIKKPDYGTYFVKSTNRNGLNWYFGTLYDTPYDHGSARTEAILNTANQGSAKHVNNYEVAKFSVYIKNNRHSSTKGNAYLSTNFTKSEEKNSNTGKSSANIIKNGKVYANENDLESAKATANIEKKLKKEHLLNTGYGYNKVKSFVNSDSYNFGNFDADINGKRHAYAESIINDKLHKAQTNVKSFENTHQKNYNSAKAIVSVNGFHPNKSLSNSDVLSFVESTANIDGNFYGYNADVISNLNNFGYLVSKSPGSTYEKVNDKTKSEVTIKASTNVNGHGSLKSSANIHGFGTAKSSVTSHNFDYGSIRVHADVNSEGHGTTISSTNSRELEYYRTHGHGQPTATANAEVSGFGSVTSYTKIHNENPGFKCTHSDAEVPSYASAEARIYRF